MKAPEPFRATAIVARAASSCAGVAPGARVEPARKFPPGVPLAKAVSPSCGPPPVYRPQQVVSQPKLNQGSTSLAKAAIQQQRTVIPAPPPVYRPQPLVAQAKPALWPMPKPANVVTPKLTSLQLPRQPAPSVAVTAALRSQTIQRASVCADYYCKIPGCKGKHPPTPPPSYTQASDPSIAPFLKGGSQRMGDRAFTKQRKGQKPVSADVRVPAVKRKSMRSGAGMHEFQPTDTASKVVSTPELIPYQSGARSSTDLTLFSTPGGLGGHTGLFPKSKGRGSTHTKRQKQGHDALRHVKVKGATPKERNFHRLHSAISGLAHGKQIMESDFLTGAIPNWVGAKPIEPVSKPGPSRIRFARRMQQRRERVKQRYATLYAVGGFTACPPSPPRDPIDEFGGGGDYTYAVQRPPSPPPSFTEPDPVKQEADMYSWPLAPLRHGSFYSTSIACIDCGYLNENREKTCEMCGAVL